MCFKMKSEYVYISVYIYIDTVLPSLEFTIFSVCVNAGRRGVSKVVFGYRCICFFSCFSLALVY